MFVGISGQPGKPMLRESRGLQVKVQRPLRDLFKKVPELAIDVQVKFSPSMCWNCLLEHIVKFSNRWTELLIRSLSVSIRYHC